MKIAFKSTFFLLFIFLTPLLNAQTPNDILNLLIGNRIITEEQADSIRAEAAIKQQDADNNRKSFPATAARSLQLSGVL
jgi:phosphate-selective porin OprO and OprP